MPRNGSGVYTLPQVYLAVPGTKVRAEQHNAPLEDIAVAMTDSLPRNGSAPMLGDLQMNNRRISGLRAGSAASDAARMDQVPVLGGYLSSVSNLTFAANRISYATGPNTAALAALTAFGRSLIDDNDAPAGRATLGITIRSGALDVLNNASPWTDADWLDGTFVLPGFPSPSQLRQSADAQVKRVSLGWAQTWVDFSGSGRTHSTSYRNTTGRPIQVSVSASVGTSRNFQVSANNSTWVNVGRFPTNATVSCNVVVPDGYYYRFDQAWSSLEFWSELR